MILKSVKKIIALSFLWLVCLSIVAHMIIPHDHHVLESVSCQNESCPVFGNTGHHTGLPVHCHAFNDITSEKARPLRTVQFTQVSVLEINQPSDRPSFNTDLSGVVYPEILVCFSNSFLLDCSSLRAPPSLI